MAETLLDDVLRRRAAKSLAEGDEQMVRRHAGELRQVCECDLLAHAVEDESCFDNRRRGRAGSRRFVDGSEGLGPVQWPPGRFGFGHL